MAHVRRIVYSRPTVVPLDMPPDTRDEFCLHPTPRHQYAPVSRSFPVVYVGLLWFGLASCKPSGWALQLRREVATMAAAGLEQTWPYAMCSLMAMTRVSARRS